MKTLAKDVHKQEVLKRLAVLRANSAGLWGKMSCHQMVVHLRDAFLCGLGDKIASPVKPPIPLVLFKFGALYIPFKWPQGVPTRPEMEQGVGGTAPVEFSGDRESLVKVIDRFTGTRRDFKWATHPVFGEMSERDWMRWGYLHCDHHLRQFGR